MFELKIQGGNAPASDAHELVPLDKALNGIAATFEWLDWYSSRWQLDSKTAKITSLSPGRGT